MQFQNLSSLPPEVIPKSEEKKKDSSLPSPSEAEDEEEEITVASEPKKGNE